MRDNPDGQQLSPSQKIDGSKSKEIELANFKDMENMSPDPVSKKYEDLKEEGEGEDQEGPLETSNAIGRDNEEEFRQKEKVINGMIVQLETEEDDNEEIENMDELTYCQRLKAVVTNGTFMLLCISITGLYFIVTGIQYWISDYMISELKQPEEVVFTTFGIVSISGPVLGVVVGGNLTTKFGGYTAPKSLYMACGIAAGCLLCAAPIPFVTNFPFFILLLWLLLFCGGFILPAMTGIMLSTVDADARTTANSVANLIYNLAGYLPGPYVYGAIYDMGSGNNS